MDDILAEIDSMYNELIHLENKNIAQKINPKELALFIILSQIIISWEPGIYGIIHGKMNSHTLYLIFVFCFIYEQLEKRIPYF
tara:strand:- start:245 stop:493 length:249 start_codon:yes stop_codon:yes gene_type:complete